MKKLDVKRRKQGGFILTSELILIVTIMVIGMIVGLVTMRDAITAEMEDVAEAIGSLDQTYAYQGMINGEGSAAVDGSVFVDEVDTYAGDEVVWGFLALDDSEGADSTGYGPSAGAASSANQGELILLVPPTP